MQSMLRQSNHRLSAQVTFVECSKPFRISKAKVDETLMPDLLHPNEQGALSPELLAVLSFAEQGWKVAALTAVYSDFVYKALTPSSSVIDMLTAPFPQSRTF